VKLVIFSVEEANRLLPRLRPMVEKLTAAKRDHDRASDEVLVLSMAATGAMPDSPDAVALQGARQRRGALGTQLQHRLAAVQRLGVVVKDLNQGLVDFHALMGDRLVFLCWRMDEPEVSHWHPLDGGFADRQPLKPSEIE
jgi:hypothetical protein